LFTYKAKFFDYLSYNSVNKFTYTPREVDKTFNVIYEQQFVLEDTAIEQKRIIYGIGQFIRDMGGLWIGLSFMGFFIVKISNNDE
jgi:hypothetical protein